MRHSMLPHQPALPPGFPLMLHPPLQVLQGAATLFFAISASRIAPSGAPPSSNEAIFSGILSSLTAKFSGRRPVM